MYYNITDNFSIVGIEGISHIPADLPGIVGVSQGVQANLGSFASNQQRRFPMPPSETIKIISLPTFVSERFISGSTRLPRRAVSDRQTSAFLAMSSFETAKNITFGHLCRIRTHLNVIIIFANIWYLILLIHSFNIILRIFVFINSAS